MSKSLLFQNKHSWLSVMESLQSSSEKPSAMDKNQNGSRIGFWIRIGIGNEVGIGSKDVSIVFLVSLLNIYFGHYCLLVWSDNSFRYIYLIILYGTNKNLPFSIPVVTRLSSSIFVLFLNWGKFFLCVII